jgi:PAS domain S-box-containing protein
VKKKKNSKADLLRESEDLFRMILDNVDDLIAVLDTKGQRIYNSPAYQRILKDSSAGDSFTHVHPDDRERVKALFKHVVESGKGSRTEYRYLMNDGEFRYIESQSNVVKDENGQVTKVLVVSRDTTERRLAELALKKAKEAAEAALERAALAERKIVDISEETRERIGHELHDDLGQHLTGVAFLSGVLAKQLSAKKWPEIDQVSRITTLINEAILRTRQLAQGLYPVELEDVGLQGMLGQLTSQMRTIYGIKCEVSYDESFVVEDSNVAINFFRIAQEAANNAIKHGGATGVQITAKVEKQRRIFEVTDNGSGISEEVKQGGLGMHTMHYRASLIGGTLSLKNNPEGGAKVIVELPQVG